ncbi:VOC family protein [Gorillibacterium massiliense]|uniref:VOC family protein n=1 Tax=Gorillibacterium massiliense TaxID=1280390 RepID=UPI0004BB223D|nr:VOC family protein [Gorillibacterium massiliense]
MKSRLHPDTRIGHVQIKVSRLERSIVFYRDIVGLQVLRQTTDTAEMSADGRRPLVILRELAQNLDASHQERTPHAGLYHFALLVPTRPSLGVALRNLMARHIEVGQGDHLVSEALYISDPDRNGIEIYADRPRDDWMKDPRGEYVMAADPVDIEGLLEEAQNVSWTGLPPGTTVGHVHFHVADLQRAEHFYCDGLGFDIVLHYGPSALFVSAGGYHHHVGLNTWAGKGAPPAPKNAPGLDFYSLQLTSEEERQEVLQRLADRGYKTWQDDEGVWTSMDDNQIVVKLLAL